MKLPRYPGITLKMDVSRYFDTLIVQYRYRVVPRYFEWRGVWGTDGVGGLGGGRECRGRGLLVNMDMHVCVLCMCSMVRVYIYILHYCIVYIILRFYIMPMGHA